MPPSTRTAPQRAAAGIHRGRALIWFVSAAAVLAGALPLYLIADVPDVGRSRAWVFTLAVLIWSGLRLAILIMRGAPRLFEFFFWLFCYIFMGIAPTVQIRSGLIARTTKGMDPMLDQPTALIVCLGILCFEIGALCHLLMTRNRRRSAALPRPVHPVRTAVLAVVGAAASLYFIAKVGWGGLLGTRDAAFAAREHAWPDPAARSVFYALAIYPLLVAGGALSQITRTVRGTRRAGLIVATSVCLLLLLLIVNPVASARYSLGTVLFAVAVYLGAVTSTTRTRTTLAATLGGLLFVFPLADIFRYGVGSLARDGFFGEYQGNPDYDAFWQISNALSYWLDGLVEPMRQLAGSVFFWVPRALWSAKPEDTGIVLAQYRGYDFHNLSAPLWAEMLVNGGIIAVIVGFLLLGYLLRAMDAKLVPAFRVGGVWAIAGAVFPVYMTIVLRGSLLQATGALAVALVCVLVVAGAKHHTTMDSP